MAIKASDMIGMVSKGTKKWTKQKKAEERNAHARWNRFQAMSNKPERHTIKDAAYACMEDAYNKVSSYGAYAALARQIMYAARGYILANADTEVLNGATFRNYLKDYIQEHGLEDEWNVAFDDRGTLYEPHTDKKVPIGTLDVSTYLEDVRAREVKLAANTILGDPPLKRLGEIPEFTDVLYTTMGPEHRYGAIMIIEKEGFMPLFEQVELAERYDIAILANKGQSVDAVRSLIDNLCAVDTGVPVFIVRDFDIAGFSIAAKVSGRNTRHYTFDNEIQSTDLGLRLHDCVDLESEPVLIKSKRPYAKIRALQKDGATKEEINFLFPIDTYDHDAETIEGQRVELNAFTSEEFIAWLEEKFAEYGVEKVIPSDDVLYRRAFELERYRELLEAHKDEIVEEAEGLELPKNLTKKIRKKLAKNPEMSWDGVVNSFAKKEVES